jgi:hypothetical protein
MPFYFTYHNNIFIIMQAMFISRFSMLTIIAAFILYATELPPQSSKELLEARLVANGTLRPNQHLSESEFSRILDSLLANRPQQERKRPEGLYTASGEFIPPEKVPEYFRKMGGQAPT